MKENNDYYDNKTNLSAYFMQFYHNIGKLRNSMNVYNILVYFLQLYYKIEN